MQLRTLQLLQVIIGSTKVAPVDLKVWLDSTQLATQLQMSQVKYVAAFLLRS